jgi:hypothetical protein
MSQSTPTRRVKHINTENEPVKVVIRIRPYDDEKVVFQKNNSINIINPKTMEEKEFGEFFHIFDSTDNAAKDQVELYVKLGEDLIKNAYAGYNCCILAYGQSGSGKTYTMIGDKSYPGLIPQICQSLFSEQKKYCVNDMESDTPEVYCEVSFLEIYAEKIYDLLDTDNKTEDLKIRQHPVTGPYVEKLTKMVAQSDRDIMKYIKKGVESRRICATNLNARSSRSHAVFTIYWSLVWKGRVKKSKTSKINLVDLAGSERVETSGVVGQAFEEATAINLSLSNLSKVIQELGKQKKTHISFRNSTLTWFLSESLGGNSKTVMIGNVNPSEKYYKETVSTLRYMLSATKLTNTVKINENVDKKAAEALKLEIEKLRAELETNQDNKHEELLNELKIKESLLFETEKTWEDKLKQTETLNRKIVADLKIELEAKDKQIDDLKTYYTEKENQDREDYEYKIQKSVVDVGLTYQNKLWELQCEIKKQTELEMEKRYEKEKENLIKMLDLEKSVLKEELNKALQVQSLYEELIEKYDFIRNENVVINEESNNKQEKLEIQKKIIEELKEELKKEKNNLCELEEQRNKTEMLQLKITEMQNEISRNKEMEKEIEKMKEEMEKEIEKMKEEAEILHYENEKQMEIIRELNEKEKQWNESRIQLENRNSQLLDDIDRMNDQLVAIEKEYGIKIRNVRLNNLTLLSNSLDDLLKNISDT